MDRDASVAQLHSITGLDPHECIDLLESTGWNLDVAASTFFAAQEGDSHPPPRNAQADRDAAEAAFYQQAFGEEAEPPAHHPLSQSSQSLFNPSYSSNSSAYAPLPSDFLSSSSSASSSSARSPHHPSSSSSSSSDAASSSSAPQQPEGWGPWLLKAPFRLAGKAISTGLSLVNRFIPLSPRPGDLAHPPSGSEEDFTLEFERKFGPIHPAFFRGTYQQATLSARQRNKFLLVYLHSPSHQNTASFCRNVLTDSTVLTAIESNFLMYGGSITKPQPYHLAHALRASTFPFLAILVPSASNSSAMQLLDSISGPITAQEVVQRLQMATNAHGFVLAQQAADIAERTERQRLREEQEAAYQQSIEEDRRREAEEREKNEREEREAREQREKEEREAREREEKEQEAQRRAEERLACLRSLQCSVLPEPSPSPSEVATLRIRMPDGSSVTRRFHKTNLVATVQHFVAAQSMKDEDVYSLPESLPSDSLSSIFEISLAYPRKILNPSRTLVEEDVYPQASLVARRLD